MGVEAKTSVGYLLQPILFLSVCPFIVFECLLAHMYTHARLVPMRATRERVVDPLELESQLAVGLHVGVLGITPHWKCGKHSKLLLFLSYLFIINKFYFNFYIIYFDRTPCPVQPLRSSSPPDPHTHILSFSVLSKHNKRL